VDYHRAATWVACRGAKRRGVTRIETADGYHIVWSGQYEPCCESETLKIVVPLTIALIFLCCI